MPRSMLAVVTEVGDEATQERLARVLRPAHEHVLERMRAPRGYLLTLGRRR